MTGYVLSIISTANFDATILVPPDFQVALDSHANVIMERLD